MNKEFAFPGLHPSKECHYQDKSMTLRDYLVVAMNKEPAFPGLHPSKECHYQDKGMTLRDYFAAKALQGLLAHPASDSHGDRELAQQAFNMADSMLEARNK